MHYVKKPLCVQCVRVSALFPPSPGVRGHLLSNCHYYRETGQPCQVFFTCADCSLCDFKDFFQTLADIVWTNSARARSVGSTRPDSVMKPLMSDAGVVSKAGFRADEPSAAIRTRVSVPSFASPETTSTSSSSRNSMGMAEASGVARSTVDRGAAT